MSPLSQLGAPPPFPIALINEPLHRKAAFPQAEQVEWEPREGSIYRDLNDRHILVLTSDIDKLLVEFVDGSTRIIDIFEWRDLQPAFVSLSDRCYGIADG